MAEPTTRTIYVALLDEGTDVWRPVDAIDRGGGLFEIPVDTTVPEDETWQFAPGSTIRCGFRQLSESGVVLVAEEGIA